MLYALFLVGYDNITSLSASSTSYLLVSSGPFYMILLLSTSAVIFIDLLILAVKKEASRGLLSVFVSIIRRGRENEVKLFEDIVAKAREKSRVRIRDKEKREA